MMYTSSDVRLIEAEEKHLGAIKDIFNEAILNSTALYEYEPRSDAVIQQWWQLKLSNAYPVLVLVDENDRVLGFTSYGSFRPHPAFGKTVEHSLYVHKDERGHGYGSLLLQACIQRANEAGFHVMIGAIDADNTASIALHKRFGFEFGGELKQVGFKFGRWLNLVFYQRILR